MGKEKFRNFQNPLANRGNKPEVRENKEVINIEEKTKFIYKYGRTTNISSGLLKFIDYNDKKFINRIYDNVEDLYNEDLTDLIESIKEIGLLNTVYILEKDEVEGKKFVIVSGLRRLLAIKKLLDNGEEIKEVNKTDR